MVKTLWSYYKRPDSSVVFVYGYVNKGKDVRICNQDGSISTASTEDFNNWEHREDLSAFPSR